MINVIVNTIYKEWNGNGPFLGRGNFTEILLSVAETLTGIHILIFGGRYHSILVIKFADVIPLSLFGSIWLLSGLSTLFGIGLYLLDYPIGKTLRLMGSFGSVFVWSAAAITLFPSVFMYIYFVATIAGMRTTGLVYRN